MVENRDTRRAIPAGRAIRNIGILAHVDAGKTTLTEHLLYASGAIRSLGSVDAGTSQTDSLVVEKERGISVRAASTALNWKDVSVRIIDTPGHADFYPEVERSLRVLDGAVLVVSAVEGIQLQTMTIWAALQELNVPTLLFVNKLDRSGSRPNELVVDMGRRFSAGVVPVQSVSGTQTRTPAVRPLRDSILEMSATMERLATVDDRMMERFAANEACTWEELEQEIIRLAHQGVVYPVLFGAAMLGVGVVPLLEAIVRYLPGPTGRNENPLSGLIYKVESGGSKGRVSHVRVFEGTIEAGRPVPLEMIDELEKPSRIHKLVAGGQYEPVEILEAGDIGVLHGLRHTKVGQILGNGYAIPSPVTPTEPLLTARIQPGRADQWHALYKALKVLEDEDPLLSVEWLEEQREISIRFFGEIQMEITRDLLASRFGLDTVFSEPRVIYRETPCRTAEAVVDYRTHGYAIIHIRVDPLPLGSGFEFSSNVKAEKIYHKFMKQIPRILEQSRRKGPRGWEVTDFMVTVLDGHSKYDLGTKPGDFKIVTPMALERALEEAGTRLLEPILEFQITAPEAYRSQVSLDLVRMRARFDDPKSDDGRVQFTGHVPFAEIFRNTATLYASSHGQGVLRTKFSGYSPI